MELLLLLQQLTNHGGAKGKGVAGGEAGQAECGGWSAAHEWKRPDTINAALQGIYWQKVPLPATIRKYTASPAASLAIQSTPPPPAPRPLHPCAPAKVAHFCLCSCACCRRWRPPPLVGTPPLPLHLGG